MAQQQAPFPMDPVLLGIALAFQQGNFIADSVLPRMGVGSPEFRWNQIGNLRDVFKQPDSRVGRLSTPNSVQYAATELTAGTYDFGLRSTIPLRDIERTTANYNPVNHAVAMLKNHLLTGREKRVADMVTTAANYGSSNKATLGAGTQFNDDTSNPVEMIQDHMDSMLVRPNKFAMARPVWSAFRRNPAILTAIKSTGGEVTKGVASREAVKELFEVDEILVGDSRVNSAPEGLTEVIGRAWGEFFLMFYDNPIATFKDGVTFGKTAQFGSPFAGQHMVHDNAGTKGGVEVRYGEELCELVLCYEAGFLYSDVLA